MFALLRYEYNPAQPNNIPLFGPRFDSQDTWIFHSKFPIIERAEPLFNIQLGSAGCDNKILYLFNILGYEIVNDPLFIQTWHVHSTNIRNYNPVSTLKEPWAMCVPAEMDPQLMPSSLGYDPRKIAKTTENFQTISFDDNRLLYDYIVEKRENEHAFVIPRVSGIENNFAVFGRIMKERGPTKTPSQINQYIQNVTGAMKNNAGIKISSNESVIKYSDEYLKAFDYCEIFRYSYIIH
jgi:hypothetical protein